MHTKVFRGKILYMPENAGEIQQIITFPFTTVNQRHRYLLRDGLIQIMTSKQDKAKQILPKTTYFRNKSN